jgi:hypothetical protein
MKKYAIVKFLSSKDEGLAQGYLYENPVNAKKYDAVVVPTRYGLSLAVVDDLTDSAESFQNYGGGAIKAIAEVVESDEVAKVTTAQKKRDLKKAMEKKTKELDDVERFSMYAKQDPEFAKMLEEYKSL